MFDWRRLLRPKVSIPTGSAAGRDPTASGASGRSSDSTLAVKHRPQTRTPASPGTARGLQEGVVKTWTWAGQRIARAWRSRSFQHRLASDHGSWFPGAMKTGGHPATSNAPRANWSVAASTPS